MNRGRPPKTSSPTLESVSSSTVGRASVDRAPVVDAEVMFIPSADDHDLAHVLLGRASMASALEKLTTVSVLMTLQEVKSRKLYRALAGKRVAEFFDKSPDASEFLRGTWEEYCGLLGMSVNKVDEDLKNLAAFGEEALQRLNSVGAGYRELRKLRKLPEGDRATLIDLARADDPETLQMMVDDLTAKNQALKAKNIDQEQTLASRQRLLENARSDADRLQGLISRPFKPDPDSAAASAEEQQQLQAIDDAKFRAIGAISSLAAMVGQTLSGRPTKAMAFHAEAAVSTVCERLVEVTEDRGIRVFARQRFSGIDGASN